MSISLRTQDLNQVHNQPSLRLNNNLKNGQNVSFKGAPRFTQDVVGTVMKKGADGKLVEETVKVGRKLANFLSSPKLHKALACAQENSAVFSAATAFAFACFLRPATIMALPGKDIEDKTYASGHSIASGAIGLLASVLLLNPIADGFKKVAGNPVKYLKQGAKYLGEKGPEFASSRAFSAAQKYTNMIPDIAIAIPRAMLTIAIIPTVLKYVFGLEKKGSGGKPQPNNPQSILQNYAAINFKSANMPEKPIFQNFKGGVK